MQEVKKTHNQVFRADLAVSISLQKLESNESSWLQVGEGVSKLLWKEGARDTICLRFWDLS